MYLLDTVVLSELRKEQRWRNPGVVAWIETVAPADLFVSVLSIGESERGIEGQRAVHPAFADALAGWLEVVLRVHGDRILPVTVGIARRWGKLSARIGNKGLDLAIAATALEHGLTVATRNLADFAQTGAASFNPFETPPRAERP
ncbi:MAG: type II toxin-antitoxin system VapC family toxin [Rhodospirillales bacterium]|nr:type II toxin-antitoxin system VapC family toxin [Rhodospirillales bacterium]